MGATSRIGMTPTVTLSGAALVSPPPPLDPSSESPEHPPAARTATTATSAANLLLMSNSPHLAGGLNDQPQLGSLLLVGQRVAVHGGGEAALRGQAQLLQGYVGGCLVDAPPEVVLALQLAPLGGDQAQHDLLARRHEAQRGEAAG